MPIMGAGDHDVEVVGHYLGELSNEKRTKYIAIEFKNDLGEHIAAKKWLTPPGLPYAVKDLITCGWDAAADNFDVRALDDTHKLDAHRVSIVVDEQENDSRYMEVKFINPLGQYGGRKVVKLEDTSWAEELCDGVKAAVEAAGDDIPF